MTETSKGMMEPPAGKSRATPQCLREDECPEWQLLDLGMVHF